MSGEWVLLDVGVGSYMWHRSGEDKWGVSGEGCV